MTERLAHAFAGTLLAILILLSPRGLSGQAPPPLRPATLHAELLLWPLSPQETASEEGGVGITPRGAMLRSFLIPGWGHAALGSYNRGGFYFLAEALSGWMLVKTGRSLRSAKGRRDLIEEEVEGLACVRRVSWIRTPSPPSSTKIRPSRRPGASLTFVPSRWRTGLRFPSSSSS